MLKLFVCFVVRGESLIRHSLYVGVEKISSITTHWGAVREDGAEIP